MVVLEIHIRNSSGQPIYEQIGAQIKGLILSGEFKQGDPLPSIRALARDLRISVITTKRAYDELEREGYIYTVSAKGCFVARRNPQLAREEQLKKIEGEMQRIVELAAAGGISRDELSQMFRLLVLEKEEQP